MTKVMDTTYAHQGQMVVATKDKCQNNQAITINMSIQHMEPPDKSSKAATFANSRKQRIREMLENYFYRNNDVYEALDLDNDYLEMMEDRLDLNPHDGFGNT
ncbi:hypothetical protein Tco_1231855 [Tanacetum coccineum]